MAQPNILLIVSDEERRNDWLRGKVPLPAHDRLAADGLSFDRHYTHASPCSPSRASLYTGRYLAEHGVVNNVSFPTHVALDPEIPTTGSLLRDVGYECGYVGKWHLSHSPTPEMMDYGYSGWTGNDKHFTGNPWTGRHFDPIIAADAQRWLAEHARSRHPLVPDRGPGEPARHHVVPDRPDRLPGRPSRAAGDLPLHPAVHPGRRGPARRRRRSTTPGCSTSCRPTSTTISTPSPRSSGPGATCATTSTWSARWTTTTTTPGCGSWTTTPGSTSASTTPSPACSGPWTTWAIYDDTTVIYTSDHGDACGSHGLRAKLPCVYEEVMGVPLIVKSPEVEAGRTTDALSTHVDLAHTIVSLGGGDTGRAVRRVAGARAGRSGGPASGRGLLRPGLGPVAAPGEHPLRGARASSTARPSTPGTTASAAASGGTGRSTRRARPSTSTPTSTTRTTSGTRPPRIRTS